MHARLTSTHLVGRVAELAELELALAQAATGRPGLVWLGGESGIGKTRLLNEFEQRVHGQEQGPLVLRGEAVDTGEGELPYGPLLSALRPLVRVQDPALEDLAPGSRRQLAALLPGLDDGAQRVERDDPSAQVRLFEALLELLDCLSDRHPVVLILEDLHWADRSTRSFVTYLARSLRHERLLVLLSYRTDELHRRHPLRPLLAELERLGTARRLELPPLDRSELTEALADILGERPGAELVERIYSRAEGNPLYTEELLAAGLDGRGAAPHSLRDAFMLRIEGLSPSAQQAARAIAVGRALPEPTIAEVTGLGHDELQAALREAVAGQVLVPSGEDRLGFRHELLREALYDDLLPGERAELHLALAHCIERRMGSGETSGLEPAAAAAAHYAAAGDQPGELRASVLAAQAAWEVHAAGETARLAERALQLWSRVSDPEQLTGAGLCDLQLLAAGALYGGGEPGRAEQLIRRALEDLGPDAAPHAQASLLGLLGRVQWQLNRGLEGVRTAKRALDLLPASEPSRERNVLLGWLARTELLRGRFRDAERDGHEALAAALATQDRLAEAHALVTLGMAECSLGQLDSGSGRLREAGRIYHELGDIDGAATAYSDLADMLALRGRTTEALEVARDTARRVPHHLRACYDWMQLTLSETAFLAGEWNTARAHLLPPPDQLVGVRLIFRLLREAELSLGEGDLEVAARCLEQAQPLIAHASEPQWIGSFGALSAELRRRHRDLEGARAAVSEALDRIELCTDDIARVAQVSATGLRVEADLAQRGRDLAERGQVREALTRARLHLDRLKAAAGEGGPVEAAWEATGVAEMTRARGRSEPRRWLAAAERWAAVQRPYEVALTSWRAAEAAALAGDRAMASEPARLALDGARELGSRWLEAEVGGLIQRARLTAAAHPEPGPDQSGERAARTGEPVSASEDPFGLTAREREVLALLAQGATNRQIAAALFMAEKTASVHVSRILAKLGVRSRTQAAAVAHRMGLATAGLAGARPR